MRFIFDENISGPYLGILSNYDRENSFESSIHLFGQGISDIELFQGIGWLDDNPVLVGYDRRILDQPAERAALREVGIDYIIFTKHWQKQPHKDACRRLLQVWDGYCSEIRKARYRCVYKAVFGRSKLERICRTGEL